MSSEDPQILTDYESATAPAPKEVAECVGAHSAEPYGGAGFGEIDHVVHRL